MSVDSQFGIPTKDSEAAPYFVAFAQNVAANTAALFMSAADSAALTLAAGNFFTAWQAYENNVTRSGLTLTIKCETRNTVEALVRLYSIQIKYNAAIPTTLKESLGIRQPNPSRVTIETPTTQPMLTIVGALEGSQTLRFADATSPTRRGKPAGVSLLELWVSIGATEASDRTNARSIGLFTKNPVGIAFQESDNQKIATYWGRWANQKGQYGPFGPSVSMTIAA